MVLSLASLAGLPPTSGFVAKVYILRNIFIGEQFMWLAVVAIINTVISLYYYFSIVKAMYFMENPDLEAKKSDKFLFWSIIIFSSQNILFYLYWSRLWDYLDSLVSNMGII
jgi:NADH-quinone oxidoreductase subunit N